MTAPLAAPPRPLSDAPPAALAAVRVVLTDIDGTLTGADGRLDAATFAAMERLAAAGIGLVPVTGRPAGWGDAIARQWPVRGVVAETGALWMAPAANGRGLRLKFLQDEAERAANADRLRVLLDEIRTAFPEARPAQDQRYRLIDLAIDHAEAVVPLPPERVEAIAAFARARGAVAQASAIHINIWFGAIDKAAGARHFLAHELGLDLADSGVLFIGDAPNDVSLFEAVPLSIGVANAVAHLPRLDPPPAYLTREAHGAGFAELAEALLAARG
jgi:hypothetical protein